MLQLAEKDGFTVKNVDNVAGHIEMGEGEELIGILCHVDVVPEGDGWSRSFGAEIRNGRIYARGAIDDKGPTMAAYHAMKLVRELGKPLNKRVRMIIGTDEESDWRCVDRYFESGGNADRWALRRMLTFPIISAEKGIWDYSSYTSSGCRTWNEFRSECFGIFFRPKNEYGTRFRNDHSGSCKPC